jgi:hypothetical protein
VTTKSWPLADHVFHLAEAENWPMIEREGLLSTEQLIRRAGLDEKSARVFRGYRARVMRLPSGAIIRDQRPMHPSALTRCLQDGLAP